MLFVNSVQVDGTRQFEIKSSALNRSNDYQSVGDLKFYANGNGGTVGAGGCSVHQCACTASKSAVSPSSGEGSQIFFLKEANLEKSGIFFLLSYFERHYTKSKEKKEKKGEEEEPEECKQRFLSAFGVRRSVIGVRLKALFARGWLTLTVF